MQNLDKFKLFREKYPDFIYKDFSYIFNENYLEIEYLFEIVGLEVFRPKIRIPRKYIIGDLNTFYLEYLIGNIGLIELISYVKCTCSKNIIIDALYINDEQIHFLKKLYFNGLGELLYTNGIDISIDELFNIKCTKENAILPKINYTGIGNLICVGGGKDSCVSLELLKNEDNNSCLIINPKTPALECSKIAGYNDNNIIGIERILDRKIIELNKQGYLNGHTPLSALIAFVSFLIAYLTKKKNIILSNESSANEATVIGTNINHQYSKTYEAELDFNNYLQNILKLDIKYFSLLRGLSEFNIAKIFARYKKYHLAFKSCNLGSKEKEWIWCCNCAKCLFIYIILSPFISLDERIKIFGENLYEREDLLNTFLEIVGYSSSKPFECVGTYSEARYAVSLVINKGENGYLLDYFSKNYPLELDGVYIEKYNDMNNLGEYYNKLVQEELKNV